MKADKIFQNGYEKFTPSTESKNRSQIFSHINSNFENNYKPDKENLPHVDLRQKHGAHPQMHTIDA
jgi:hypothetical protein